MTVVTTTAGISTEPLAGGPARQMVEAFARLGAKGFDLLLARGESFRGRPPTAEVPRLKKWARREKPKTRQCFMNAQRFCLANPDAHYYEGYWWGGLIPVHHGWIVLDGQVVDFTAEAVDRLTGRDVDPATNDYFGVHVPTDFLMKSIARSKLWTGVLGEYLAPGRGKTPE